MPNFKAKANTLRVQKISNAGACLEYMKAHKVRLYNVSAEGSIPSLVSCLSLPLFHLWVKWMLNALSDIVDGNITFLLAMTWSLARTYQIGLVTQNLTAPSNTGPVHVETHAESTSYSLHEIILLT